MCDDVPSIRLWSLSAFYTWGVTTSEEPNTCWPSTTSGSTRATLKPPARATRAGAPKALRWSMLSRWNPRKRLTITVTYRGGSGLWYEVSARGVVSRFCGTECFHCVMNRIYGGTSGARNEHTPFHAHDA